MAGTWHERHIQDYTFGQRLADRTAAVLGSWPFIIGQTALVAAWISLNLVGLVKRWDPYPFILLNLMFSIQAAYAGPIIMMSQNRQAERDRYQAQSDYETNVKAEAEIEALQATVARLEEKDYGTNVKAESEIEALRAAIARLEEKVDRLLERQ